jgi:peptidoglycan/xylan/chitin deacetylase (PgdA/CDA1 family)
VNTETIGSGDYLSWDELRELRNYGIEIGNHTHSHAYFLNEPPEVRRDKFIQDVSLAQKLIKEKLDFSPVVFAYPFGEFDNGMREAMIEMRFQGAAAQNSGVISEYSDPFALPRFPMTDAYGQMQGFIEKVKMNPLPVVEIVPETTIPETNPPVLTIVFPNRGFDLDRLQCFIQGGESRMEISEDDSLRIRIIASRPLQNRRHLYTITVPHKTTNEWYWYSHQWVFPENGN